MLNSHPHLRIPTVVAVLLMGLLTVVACNSVGRRAAMLAVLDQTDSLNRNYILITTDSLIREAADYFDSHGTPNERVRAHYLLGCAYRDMGEAPRAIEAWQDAIAYADTTAADCNYALMAKACSQMAEAFYQQNLVVEDLKCLDQAIYYAYHAQDTLAAMISYAYKMSAYDRIGLPDSVEIICDRYYSQMLLMGYERLASQNACMGVNALLTLNKVNKAKFYLDSYEAHSGFFDEAHNIVSGREAYYNLKGRYFQAIHQYDSAKYYFLKELQYGSDYMNQNMASLGLAHVFQASHCPDSAVKYALYSYEMNDSVYAQMSTEEVEKTKNLYNYNRYQHEAFNNAEEAHAANLRFIIASAFLMVIIVASVYFMRRNKKRKREQSAKYRAAIIERNKLRKEIESLAAKDYDTIIARKEREIAELNKTIEQQGTMHRQVMANDKLSVFEKSAIVQVFKDKRTYHKGQEAVSNDEWKALVSQFRGDMPSASSSMNSLSPLQLQVCILLLLSFEEGEIAYLRQTKPQVISNAKARANQKLFLSSDSASLKDNLISLVAS